MTEKRGGRRLYGLWITIMIYNSGRAAVWPFFEGHRFAQEAVIFAVMLLVYLLGFAGGSRSTTGGDPSPSARASDATEDPSA